MTSMIENRVRLEPAARDARSPRLLVITHTLATGGTDRVAVHIANGFARRFDTFLLNVRKPASVGKLAEMIDPAVQRISLDRATPWRVLDFVLAAFALIRQVRRLKPDLVLATGNNNSLFSMLGHLANPNPTGHFAVKITNPIVRGKDNAFRRAFRFGLYRIVLGRCDRILALSVGEAETVAALYPGLADRIRVVHNPYVTDAMMTVCDRDRAEEAETSFLVLGRLHPQKNLPLLLEAWAIARLNHARLRIAGEGGELGELVALARRLGVDATVDFLGYRSDIPDLLQAAHCLVLSSDYEGLPAVVLEAFAAGRPVVTTDCFLAASELVGTAPGCRLVPRGDVAALAAALGEMAAARCVTGSCLQERALPYKIEEAIASHVEALSL